jgi:hypothetical protein
MKTREQLHPIERTLLDALDGYVMSQQRAAEMLRTSAAPNLRETVDRLANELEGKAIAGTLAQSAILEGHVVYDPEFARRSKVEQSRTGSAIVQPSGAAPPPAEGCSHCGVTQAQAYEEPMGVYCALSPLGMHLWRRS